MSLKTAVFDKARAISIALPDGRYGRPESDSFAFPRFFDGMKNRLITAIFGHAIAATVLFLHHSVIILPHIQVYAPRYMDKPSFGPAEEAHLLLSFNIPDSPDLCTIVFTVFSSPERLAPFC